MPKKRDLDPVQASKEVTFVTPVLFGSSCFPPSLSPRTFTYKRGLPLHQDPVPAICETLSPGMVIDLPEQEVEKYIRRLLSWLPLPSDSELISHIQEFLKDQRGRFRNEHVRISDIDIMTSPLFSTLEQNAQNRIIMALQGHIPLPRMPYDNDEYEARGTHAATLLLRKKLPLNKRDAKKLEKEKEIVRLHQVEFLRPAEIARKMKVSAKEVYRACHGYLARVKKFQEFDDSENQSSIMSKMPMDRIQVRESVAQYLTEKGLYRLKRADIQEYMQNKLSQIKAPTLNEIGITLKQDFKIRYLRENPASVRYNDP